MRHSPVVSEDGVVTQILDSATEVEQFRARTGLDVIEVTDLGLGDGRVLVEAVEREPEPDMSVIYNPRTKEWNDATD